MPIRPTLLVGALLAIPAQAQQPAAPSERVIQVSGSGIVRTPPDVATLDFWLRGEGESADVATRALAARQKAVIDGLAGLFGREAEITTGQVTVVQIRGAECADTRQPRLSEGACAVVGYRATVQGNVRTGALDRAGTAAGLAARLGAVDARLQGFALSDVSDAARRATAAALRDARTRAEALAEGAGVKLGALLSVRDGTYGNGEVVVRANSMAAAPPPPMASVAIDTKPRAIETRAQVTVTYAIAP